MSPSLINREMHFKTTVRYHLTPLRMALIKKTREKWRQGRGEKGSLVVNWCTAGGNAQPLWKPDGAFFLIKKKLTI